MQSYVFGFTAIKQSMPLPVQADLFVYESGTSATDTRIKVKPGNGGAQITLKPGQRFRITEVTTDWYVEPFTPGAVIDGTVIIGSGEFDDANTLNKVTLDATFANVVTVANTTAQRVPVTLDATQQLQTIPGYMAYTNSSTSAAVAGAGLQLIAPAANINGIIINMLIIDGVTGASSLGVMLAKATPPASGHDGDVIDGFITGTAALVQKSMPNIKIPAGKGLYWYSAGDTSANQLNKSVLYTVL